jgi:hypothetical protein
VYKSRERILNQSNICCQVEIEGLKFLDEIIDFVTVFDSTEKKKEVRRDRFKDSYSHLHCDLSL